jgi:hypothetical protein
MDLIGIGWIKVPLKPSLDIPPPQTKHILHVPSNQLPEKFDTRKVFYEFVNNFPPNLRWITFNKDGLMTAEVLLSAEFVHLSAPSLKVKDVEKNDLIPPEISPSMRKFRMEVTFTGIRNASTIGHFASGRYKIEIIMGELKLMSGFSGKSFKKNLNFLDPYSSGYLLLPEQFQFWPPIIIKHLDCSHKNPTVIGASMIRRPDNFFINDVPKELQRFLLNSSNDVEAQKFEESFELEEKEPLLGVGNISVGNFNVRRAFSRYKLPNFLKFTNENAPMTPLSLEGQYTWWTKFYNSNREFEFRNDCLHSLIVSFLGNSYNLFKIFINFRFRFTATSWRSNQALSIFMIGHFQSIWFEAKVKEKRKNTRHSSVQSKFQSVTEKSFLNQERRKSFP